MHKARQTDFNRDFNELYSIIYNCLHLFTTNYSYLLYFYFPRIFLHASKFKFNGLATENILIFS